jgi:hypothetical protein
LKGITGHSLSIASSTQESHLKLSPQRYLFESKFREEFDLYVALLDSETNPHIIDNHRTATAFRLIKHDVSRTDQQPPTVRNDKDKALQWMISSSGFFACLPSWADAAWPIEDAGSMLDRHPFLSTTFGASMQCCGI